MWLKTLLGWLTELSKVLLVALNVLMYALILLAIIAGIGVLMYGCYKLVTLPLRRRERVRFFLSLLGNSIKNDGGQWKDTLIFLSTAKHTILGKDFSTLGQYLSEGIKLWEALERVPGFLPPRIVSMLKAGEESGDISKVLPICKRTLIDKTVAEERGMNYVLPYIYFPIMYLVFLWIKLFILPSFNKIASDLGVTFPHIWIIPILENILLIVMGFLILLAIFYITSNRHLWFKSVMDTLDLLFPWRKKALQRDFSSVLCLLLDAGITECEAVEMAAQSTSNPILIRKAHTVAEDLRQGTNLTDALKKFEESREFKWRLENASHGQVSFLDALTGWHEALNTQVIQQQQVVSYLITIVIVLAAGVMVGLLTIGIFSTLISFLEGLMRW